MKTIIYLAIATFALTACKKNSSSNMEENHVNVSSSDMGKSNIKDYYQRVPLNSSYGLDDMYDEDLFDNELAYDDDWDLDDYNEHYSVRENRSGEYIIHDWNGNYIYVSVDDYGNLTAHDMNGNFYHSYTDDWGNTSGFDSNGNFYHSYTDDCGNTSGFDSNGNIFNYYTDDCGNISGFDGNGNFFNAYTDNLGNTTVNYY